MIETTIVNVVATANLKQSVDLFELAKAEDIKYNSERYGGRVAYFKTPNMEGKVSIFSSGKMISVGTKSESQARKELTLTMKFLVEKGLAKSIELQPKTQNLVATADFEKCIDLEKIPEDTGAIYEPEQFPGAILHLETPFKTTILVFASGKAVITGLKSSDQINPTIRRIEEIIASYE